MSNKEKRPVGGKYHLSDTTCEDIITMFQEASLSYLEQLEAASNSDNKTEISDPGFNLTEKLLEQKVILDPNKYKLYFVDTVMEGESQFSLTEEVVFRIAQAMSESLMLNTDIFFLLKEIEITNHEKTEALLHLTESYKKSLSEKYKQLIDNIPKIKAQIASTMN